MDSGDLEKNDKKLINNLKIMPKKKLHRSQENKILAGVLGGIGEYSEVDPAILRIIFILILIFTGFIPGTIAYLLFIVILPKEV